MNDNQTPLRWIACVLLFVLPWSLNAQSWGDGGTDGYRESASTAIDGPGWQAFDESPNTAWRLSAGASSGWLELFRSVAQEVRGVRVVLDLKPGSELGFSALVDGAWTPLPGAVIVGPASGERTLAFSGDRFRTPKLLMTLGGESADQGRIQTLEWLTERPAQGFGKILPQKVTLNQSEYINLKASRLWDGIAGNSWFEPLWDFPWEVFQTTGANKPEGIFPPCKGNPPKEAEIIWELGGTYQIQTLKGHFIQSGRSVRFEFWDGTKWTKAQAFGGGWTGSGQGWQRIELTNPVSTDRIRISFPGGWERARFVGELEVWGVGVPLGSGRPLIIPPALADGGLLFTIDDAPAQDSTLEVARLGRSEAPLTGSFNQSPWTVQPSSWVNGHTVYRVPLEAGWYRQGTQFLRIDQGAGVREAVVFTSADRGRLDLGWPYSDGILAGTEAGPSSPVPALTDKTWTLGGEYSLEKLRIYSPHPFAPTLKTGITKSRHSVTWTTVLWKAQGTGWWEADLGGLKADQLALVSWGPSPSPIVLDEIELWGTRLKDTKVGLEVWWPRPGQEVTAAEKDGNSVIGWLGDSRVSPLVNGFHPRQSDKLFWMPLAQMDWEPDQEGELEVTGSLEEASSGHKQHLRWTKNPPASLDQGPEFLATGANSLVLSGTVKDAKSRVFVNGVEVPLTGTKYSTAVSLNEGFQLVSIAVWDKNKKKVRIQWDKAVWRSAGEPLIQFDQPAGDLWTQAEGWTVTGRVAGGVGLTLTMNGSPVVLSKNAYSVPLAAGQGTRSLEFQLTDSLGRIKVQTLNLFEDREAPQPAVVFPAEGEYLRHTPVEFSATADGEAPLWWKINDEDWVLDYQGVHRVPYHLADGFYTFRVQAQDRSGNLSGEQAVSFVVDVTPPEAFSIGTNLSGWTPNSTPTLTFGTSDATSGIDHYEYSADGGEWVTVTSPHTPTLADGTHQLYVRAFDKAGNSTLSTVTAQIDVTAPQDFLIQSNLSGWTSNSTPTLTFTTPDATSGVDRYEYSADGGGWVTVNSPLVVPALTDGTHQLSVRVFDKAGNSTLSTITALIDVTSPQAFAPAVNVTGWTSNNRPIFTFGTTDATSGVNRYEVMDESAWAAQVSPYQTPALIDGQHLVLFRAIDEAGNASPVSSLEVWVDTTAPVAPMGFKAVPSGDQVAVGWLGPQEEGESYRLERAVGLASQIIPLTAGEYLDTDLAVGQTVGYRAWVVDRAGNTSPMTPWDEVVVGTETAPVTETGVQAEYEGFEVQATGTAFAPDVKQVLLKTVPIDQSAQPTDYPVVGPVYEARVVRNTDSGTTETDHADLSAPVQLTIAYNPADIPPGSTEAQLKPYYYDSVWARWLPIEGARINTDDHTITFKTDHFSDFTVQASTASDLTPQQMREAAFSPFGTPNIHAPVSVSNEGGSVSTEFTEYLLPGKNGLDLVIKRTWDTGTAQADADVASSTQGDSPWRLGTGWRLNFPSLKWNGDGLWVKGLDGQSFSFDQTQLGSQNSSTGTFVVETHERVDARLVVTLANGLQKAVLYHKDGRSVEYDRLGRVTKITDVSGRNTIIFAYDPTAQKASSIVDTLGRQVSFTYAEGNIETITVTAAGESFDPAVKYVYESGRLKTATDVGGRVWSYGYTTASLTTSSHVDRIDSTGGSSEYSPGGDPSPTVKSFPVLSTVTGPGIGTSVIAYDKPTHTYQDTNSQSVSYTDYETHTVHDYWEKVTDENGKVSYKEHFRQSTTAVLKSITYTYYFTVKQERLVAQSVTVKRSDADPKPRTTNYQFGFQEAAEKQFVVTSSSVDDGLLKTSTQFGVAVKERNKLSVAPEVLKAVSSLGLGLRTTTPEAVTFPVSVTVAQAADNAVIETETRQWDTGPMRPTQTKRQRAADNFTQSVYVYDLWGNPTSVVESTKVGARATAKTTTVAYYNTGSSNLSQALAGLPAMPEMAAGTTVWSLPATKKTSTGGVETWEAYHYNSQGQLIEARQWNSDVNAWALTRYTYRLEAGEDGQLKTVVDPEDQQTSYDYDYTSVPGRYVVSTSKASVDLGAASPVTLTTRVGYSTLTGNAAWSQDARGFITQRKYDNLGRVTDVLESADTDAPSTEVIPILPLWTQVATHPYTHVTYDDTALTSSVRTPLGGKTLYQFDSLGRLTDVQKTNAVLSPLRSGGSPSETITTKLEYDRFGRVLEVKGPVSNQEADNTRTLETLKTSFTYDALGRVLTVLAPGAQRAKTSTYDNATNLVTTFDELLNQSQQILDWNGKPLMQRQMVGGQWSTVQTTYDADGRTLTQVDPNGNTTTISYNTLGLVSTITSPAREVWEGGQKITGVTPVTTKSYNKAGVLTAVSETTPAGARTTSFAVNGLGQTLGTSIGIDDDHTLVTKQTLDENGNPLTQTSGYQGGAQHTKSATYDSHNRVKTETNERGYITTYTYDPAGNRTGVRDPRQTLYSGDFTLTLAYDQLSRLIEATLPQSAEVSTVPKLAFDYDGRGNLVERREADQQTTVYTYTKRNQLKTQTVTDGSTNLVTRYTYDDAGRQSTVTTPEGVTIETYYDEAGRPLRQGNDGRGWNQSTYDKNGNVLTQTDGRGYTTSYTYNAANQVLTQKNPLNQVTAMDYDRLGQTVRTTDGENNVRSYTYDTIGRLIEEKTPWGATLTTSYHAWGTPHITTDGRGTTTTREYTPDNKLSLETLINGTTTLKRSFEYDEGGDLKSATDGAIVTHYNLKDGIYQADPYGLTTTTRETVAGIVLAQSYQYDNRQRLAGYTSPDNLGTNYSYNTLGQLTGMTSWIRGELNYKPATGQLTGFTLANNTTKTLEYDNQGRLASLAYTDAAAAVLKAYDFGYDQAGNIVTKNSNTYTYDQLNRLIGANEQGWFQKQPGELNAGYAASDRDYKGTKVLSFTVTPTDTVSLDMSARSVGVDLGSVLGINKIKLQDQNTSHRIREEDLSVYLSPDNQNYTKITGYQFTANTDGSIDLEFPTIIVGRYVKVNTIWDDRNVGNQSVDKATFKNKASQLVQVWTLSQSHQELYDYDAAGNRNELTVNGTVQTYQYYQNSAGGNLPWLAWDQKWYYQYDNNGNLITKAKAATVNYSTRAFTVDTSQEYWNYAWDGLNRLTSVSKNGALLVAYTYDADNLRVARTKGAETTVYAYGRNGALTYQKNLATSKARTYAYLGSEVVGWTDTAADGTQTKMWALTDQLGSVTKVTNASAEVVWSSEYNPFGKTAGIEGLYDFDGSYAGHQPDNDVGLIYMWNRWQDPETGRFISEDPAQFGSNFYAYASSNPTNFVDPTGLYEINPAPGVIIETTTGKITNNGTTLREGSGGGGASPPPPPPPAPAVPSIREQFMDWWSTQQARHNLLAKQEDALRAILQAKDPAKFQEMYTDYLQGITSAMGPEYANIVRDLAESSAILQGGGEALRFIEDMEASGKTIGADDLTNAALKAAEGQNLTQSTIGAFVYGFLAGGVSATAGKGVPAPGRGTTQFINGVRVVDRRTGTVLEGTVDLRSTLQRIEQGGTFPHRNDGSIFSNRPLPGKTTPELPGKPAGYYTEYVHPTPGIQGPGPQRVVRGAGGDLWYTPDHYGSFIRLNP